MTMNLIIAILSWVCLVSAFITYGLGIAVYTKNPRSEVNRLFLLAMLSAACWAFCEFMIWQAGSPEGVRFWLKASSFWPFVIAFTVTFVLALTGSPVYRKNRNGCLAAIYTPAGVISIILLFTDWIYTTGYLSGTLYTYLPVRESIAYQLEATYILLVMLFAAGIVFSFWQQATTKKESRQAQLVFIAIATIILFGFFSGILLPAFALYTPNLVFIGIVIFSLIITVAIQKHELFILNPRTAVPDILRTMPDALILADMHGRIVSANDASMKIFHLEGNSLPGEMVTAHIPEPAFLQIKKELLNRGNVTDLETVPAGTDTKMVSIAGSLILDPYGEPAGMVLIVRDITDRKATEKALRIAGEKISLLTQVTRHDINNLISALSGYLLLLKENPDDPSYDQYVSACMDIAEKISDQLRFTREYQDLGIQKPAWQSLGLLVNRAMNDLLTDSAKVNITMEILPVEIYSDQLTVKVLYNLIENAIRHGSHLTRIHVSTRILDGEILNVTIEDDGIGISEKDKKQIFRYGFGKNTGLGLAISRDILSLTGIAITETGTAGAGARFELTVPRSAWRSLAS